MKKIFYIAIVILVALGGYLYWQHAKTDNTPAVNTEAFEPDTPRQSVKYKNCNCKSECICPNGEADCDCERTKSVCTCEQPDGQHITFESIETNEDIEELNPEETSEEEETIISE